MKRYQLINVVNISSVLTQTQITSLNLAFNSKIGEKLEGMKTLSENLSFCAMNPLSTWFIKMVRKYLKKKVME